MAYILGINEKIIEPKTNPKPIQKRSKTGLRIIHKQDV
jgi:hypothetical protein